MRLTFSCFAVLCAALGAIPAQAGGVQTLGSATLDEVEVTAQSEGLAGTAASASEGTVTAKQLRNRPLLRPGEVLEVTPGLIVTQHSGDGKANQFYLRGFNLDHGTDFAFNLLGMPVNMRSHVHGQGYSDLQFLIPELVERMQYRKGAYAAEQGDFASAGSANIDYLRKLDTPLAQLTLGSYGYQRGLVTASTPHDDGNLLYALEWLSNRGPWEKPEDLRKLNGILRYSEDSKDNGWSITAMSYDSRWNATDQVPLQAIADGLIGRYGTLNPTDGGTTRRHSLSGEWSQVGADSWSRANAYFIDYGLDLWSDFTFCLNDIALNGNCNRGDQFQQFDRRKVYGLNAAQTHYGSWEGKDHELTFGMQSRRDQIDNGLLLTTTRAPWATIRQDTLNESSIGLYGESLVQWQERFRSVAGLREDFYLFDVHSSLAQNTGKVSAHIASPKLTLIFGPWDRTEYYANWGYGFHSNDARGATTRINPDFRDPTYRMAVTPATPLVRTKGHELGVRSALLPRLQTSLSIWQLDIASELVFIGDAGTTSAGFPSRRSGIEWANYWTPDDKLIVDADATLSKARYTAIDPAQVPGTYIPGSVERTLSIAATYDSQARWTGGMRLRYFGPRPLIEDNTVRSASTTLVNLRGGYRLANDVRLILDVLNLFNRQVSDIDYYYATQLRNQPAPVNGIVTHPAEPRTVRLTVRISL